MRATGEKYTAALLAERRTRPPPRHAALANAERSQNQETDMNTRPVAATRLRGIWMGVTDFKQSREFYELLGAYFDATEPVDGSAPSPAGRVDLRRS